MLCRDYALFGGHFWPKFGSGGHKNILVDRVKEYQASPQKKLIKPNHAYPRFALAEEKMCHFLKFVNEIEIFTYASISQRLRKNQHTFINIQREGNVSLQNILIECSFFS